MKIYVKQLVALAMSKTPADRAGWLLKRGEVNKSFQKRWFSLRGNLLFYFERPEREPVGLIVLEGCSIELAECSETERYAFFIIFHGQNMRTYTLAAETQEDMEGWMKALSCANYDYLRNMVAELQRQIDEIRATAARPEPPAISLNSPLAVTVTPRQPVTIPYVHGVATTPTGASRLASPSQYTPTVPSRKRQITQKSAQPVSSTESVAPMSATPKTHVTFEELHAKYGNKIQELLKRFSLSRRSHSSNRRTVQLLATRPDGKPRDSGVVRTSGSKGKPPVKGNSATTHVVGLTNGQAPAVDRMRRSHEFIQRNRLHFRA
ncbi:sesquipedalian-1-like, partial [Tropilaelaps mercedesae]